MTSLQKLNERIGKTQSLLCVGLDTSMEKIPQQFQKEKHPLFAFNKWIIEQTHEWAVAFKPNLAFFEALGTEGMHQLKMTVEYLREYHPDIFTIADAKRADIGSTNEGYVKEIFDWMGFDSVTLHPYLGQEALQPFLERQDKISIILCRTSNPGAPEFQDLEAEGRPLWQHVAQHVAEKWNVHKNCMLVVGATYPQELKKVREIVGDMTLLVPGVGAQGGIVKDVMENGLNSEGRGVLINASRSIMYAVDPAVEAQSLVLQMREARL